MTYHNSGGECKTFVSRRKPHSLETVMCWEVPVEKKERLKPLSLYGYDLEEAIRAILSVSPKKLKHAEEATPTAKSAKDQERRAKSGAED